MGTKARMDKHIQETHMEFAKVNVYMSVWEQESFLLNSGVSAYVWHKTH